MIENSVKSFKSACSTNTANEILDWLQKEKSSTKKSAFGIEIKEFTKNQEIQMLNDIINRQKIKIKDLQTKIEIKSKHITYQQFKTCKDSLKNSQLENEKLVEEIEQLGKLIKKKENTFRDKLEEQKEYFVRDLKSKQKVWLQNEQVQRDRILQERTEKIKKQTIKLMEPDIEKLLQQHRIEIFKLKDVNRQELSDSLKQIQSQHLKEIKQLQLEISSIKDRTSADEKARFDSRFLKVYEEHEFEMQKLKLKLENHFQEQLKKSELDLNRANQSKINVLQEEIVLLKKQKESDMMEVKNNCRRDLETALKKCQSDFEFSSKTTIEDITNNHNVQIKDLQDKYLNEIENTKKNEIEKLNIKFESRLEEEVDKRTKHLKLMLQDKIENIHQMKNKLDSAEMDLAFFQKENSAFQELKASFINEAYSLRQENQSLKDNLHNNSEKKRNRELSSKVQNLEENLKEKCDYIKHTQDQITILQRKHESDIDELAKENQSVLDLLKSEFQMVIANKNDQINMLNKSI
eukprot:NODE_301_length_10368_cov_0.471614.p3 type:complete len:520 gc:universal NODE_301_length_10368_cov_0.471614:1602-3161(+)